MNEHKVSHRRVRTDPLTTVGLVARAESTLTDVERLAAIAGVDLTVAPSVAELPPAVLTLVESGASGTLVARFNEVFQPEFAGQEVRVSPASQPGDILELFVAAGATQRGHIVGVIGAHGGAGTTIASAMLARVLARTLPSVALVDLDPLSPGYDLLLHLDASGKRWADISQESGTLLPGRLVESLPVWREVRVLSGNARQGAPTTGRSAMTTAASIAQVTAATVLDLPRSALHRGGGTYEWLSWCDHLLLLTQPGLMNLAAAARALEAVPPIPVTTVIAGVKGPGHADDCAGQLGLTSVCPLRFERTLGGDMAHGMTPGDRLRSGSARDIRRIATRVMA